MQCSYFDAGRCRSCTLMGQPYPAQLAAKQHRCEDLLAPFAGAPGLAWLPPVASRESGFRNKAKWVVGGTVAEPTLGILDAAGHGMDLRECGVCRPGLLACLPTLGAFITLAGLTPYDVPGRSGELKYLLVTESPDGELMLRFVLRSREPLARIRKHLPGLLRELPQLAVVSANIHPEHKAVLEGEREIVLTERETLRMRVNGIDLRLRPQSFFQTNTEIAAALYRQAREWVDEAGPDSVWDLYCGVGGFALHCGGERDVLGVETSPNAVGSARLGAAAAGQDRTRFVADDATSFALAAATHPDLVIVNPPRRGLGEELCGWLEASAVGHAVYSSCNVESLARDLARMPSLRPRRARLFDMFPQTTHHEVMVLLER